MREFDETFRAQLSSDVLSLCLCWRLVRDDGFALFLTDHDAPVVWRGEAYTPGAPLEAGRFEQSDGLAPGRAAGGGMLANDAITEEDLAAGLWNGTRVDVFRVDWQAPEHGVHLWAGYLSEITLRAGAFEAELVSLKADLERPVGRVYSRHCDASLGDARCGLSSVDGQSCDKRFATCRDVFANAQNFRGFPHMPGPDALLAGPASSGNDGSRR